MTGRLKLCVGLAGTLLAPTAAAAGSAPRGPDRPGALRKKTTEIAITTATPTTRPSLASLGIPQSPEAVSLLLAFNVRSTTSEPKRKQQRTATQSINAHRPECHCPSVSPWGFTVAE